MKLIKNSLAVAIALVASLISVVEGGTSASASSPSTVTLSQSADTVIVGQEHRITVAVTNAPDGTNVQFEPLGGLLAGTAFIGLAPSAAGGYWLAGEDGTVIPEGGAPDLGGTDTGGSNIAAIAATPDEGGYFLVTSDGAVTARGDAQFAGDVSSGALSAPIVGLAAASDNSYWLLDDQGRIFSFGSTISYGSMSVAGADAAIGVMESATGLGYTICTKNGDCEAFGDAAIGGLVPGAGPTDPLVAFTVTSSDFGLWGVLLDGAVVAMGDACCNYPAPEFPPNAPVVGIAKASNGQYREIGLDGQVSGTAPFEGDAFTRTIQDSTASIEVTSISGGQTIMRAMSNGAYNSVNNTLQITWSVPPGYWLVASDGGVFAFGDAAFYGSTGNIRLNRPIVGMASTPDGGGYWLVASDGGIFAFGDANFFGSTGALRLNRPVVGIASTPDGGGYWLAAADGGIFSFGDAPFRGSGPMAIPPYVGISPAPDGTGYLLVQANGVVWELGSTAISPVPTASQPHLTNPAVGVSITSDGYGYWVGASDGGVFAQGTALFAGSTGGITLNNPIVGLAAVPYPLIRFPGVFRTPAPASTMGERSSLLSDSH